MCEQMSSAQGRRDVATRGGVNTESLWYQSAQRCLDRPGLTNQTLNGSLIRTGVRKYLETLWSDVFKCENEENLSCLRNRFVPASEKVFKRGSGVKDAAVGVLKV